MQSTNQCQDVTAVVVTYHPGENCAVLLRQLSQQCGSVIVVDNGSTQEELRALRGWATETECDLIEVGSNTGIAAAQNLGVERARARGAQKVLLSDDDSLPASDMVVRLERALDRAQESQRVAAVGPLVGELKPGGDQLVYVARTWGPRRATARELDRPLLPAAFLIASGCLIDIEAFKAIGPMNDAFFIDHVDLEWSLRARRAGFWLLLVPAARMEHSLGDATVQLRGRDQPIHVHQPIRNYYLVRNTLLLIRSGLLGWRWSMGYIIWLAKYAAFNVLLIDRRGERVLMVLRGIADGISGRGGKLS